MTALRFNERAHRYTLDGRPIPSVTTLLKAGMPTPALTQWAARSVAEWVTDNGDKVEQLRGLSRAAMVAELKQVPWTARDRAAVRGTDVHSLAERLVKGEQVEVPEHLDDYVTAYVRWLDEWNPQPVLVETFVFSRKHWYAGRFDLLARIRDELWLLDVKTAAGVYPDNALQLAAYRGAEFFQNDCGDSIRFEELLRPDTRLGVIHVRPDGADLVPLDSSQEPWRDWLHCQWLAKREKQRKGYVLPPLRAREDEEVA